MILFILIKKLVFIFLIFKIKCHSNKKINWEVAKVIMLFYFWSKSYLIHGKTYNHVYKQNLYQRLLGNPTFFMWRNRFRAPEYFANTRETSQWYQWNMAFQVYDFLVFFSYYYIPIHLISVTQKFLWNFLVCIFSKKKM